jgi:hypothetical protein
MFRNILMLRVKPVCPELNMGIIQTGMRVNIHHDDVRPAQIPFFVERAIRHTASDLCQKITPLYNVPAVRRAYTRQYLSFARFHFLFVDLVDVIGFVIR